MKNRRLVILLLFVFCFPLWAQIQIPKNLRGNRQYRKEGVHNGNLVETLFYNFGEVAWWGKQPSGVWPKGTGDHSYMDGITPMVVTQVVNQNGDTLYMCEAGYRESMDVSPDGVERGWQPRPGYVNQLQDHIAMSDNPSSWPASWADKDGAWDGYWNGYFGKRTNADQESYFVMDDDADDGHDFYPDSTDQSRRGLGLKVGVRGFQWANVQSEDLIFWHYDITNEGTTDYEKMIFGMYVDVGVGGQFDSNDDNASFDLENDITYSWDTNGLGQGWGPTGWCGYAFLESPGNATNKIDDDGDGEEGSPVITENMILGEIPDNGIDDNQNGLVDESQLHLGLKYADGEDNNADGNVDELIDERRDDLIDNDGDWDPEKHDVGADGVAGTGDMGEGDGLPTSGEPNFDQTDKDESDQIGLTAFDVFYIGTGFAFYKDKDVYDRVSVSHFDSQLQNGNIAFLYGSGLFPLNPGQTERFSVCLVFGEDLNDIRRNKQTVQAIYNNNYNFSRPPEKPLVSAVAGDKKVTLYWDDRAESSYDVFSNPPEDFEGYKVYKSTDPGFLDARIITNAFGEKTFLKPVAQFDLQNDVEGFFPLDFQGLKFFMGENKGLRHSFVDTDVMNGKTYYYAVVSYDRGEPDSSMYPSECSRLIVQDINGNLILDDNTVAVTPQSPSAGFRTGGLKDEIIKTSGVGTGNVWIDVLDPLKVPENNTFKITFDDTTQRDTISYNLLNITTGENLPDTVLSRSYYVRGEDDNPDFDGMRLFAFTDSIEWDAENSTWTTGESNIPIKVENRYHFPQRRDEYPASYEIRFGDPDTTWWFVPRFPVNFSVWDIYRNEKMLFMLEEPRKSTRDSSLSVPLNDSTEYIRILVKDGSIPREIWRINFLEPYNNETTVLPQDGDILRIQIKTPFRSGDEYQFTTQAAKIDRQMAKNELDNICVVPNPYVVSARWEPARRFSTGRGERRLYFIHLPQKCTIRIYTMGGDHVKTLDHQSDMMDGSESWDLTTKDGLDVAPGVYIFHVDAADLGEKTGKFALIK